jgi:hypothetical protein
MPDRIVIREPIRESVRVTAPGPQGATGPPAPRNVFVGPDAPVDPADTYLWIETGLGPDGDDLTFWVEDAS